MVIALAGRLASRLPLPGRVWGLFAFVLGLYLLTMSGHTYSPDEETMLETSRALVTNGTWAIPPSESMVQVEGTGGQTYSQYGPGQSLAAVPWVAVGQAVGSLFPRDQAGYPLRLILGSYNALIAAGLAALFAALGLALGYSRWASTAGALALAFCTYLWPHSRTFFSEPLTALSLFGSFYLLVLIRRAGAVGSRRILVLSLASGALFALAVATKVQYVVALPAFLLYLALGVWSANKPGNHTPDANMRSAFRTPLLWLAGLALGLLPLMLYNLLIFGSPLSTGYGQDPTSTLTNPFFEGLLGLLISPGKGLLWYALPLLAAIWGFPRFARNHRAEAIFVITLALPIFALFSLYSFWHGDGAWGPRYLIPVLPFLLLPILSAFDRRAKGAPVQVAHSMSPLRALALAFVLGLGFLINLLGVLVNFDTYINVEGDLNSRHWTVAGSPIAGHLRLLEQRAEEWGTRLRQGTGTILFTGGFSYSEGDKAKGELLPRWTTGAGTMQIRPPSGSQEPLSITLRLTDHRPPELPRATVTILLDGTPVQSSASPLPDMPITTDYTFTAPSTTHAVTLQSDTWNPSELAEGARNETIGVKLESVQIAQSNRALATKLVEALPAPPYYPQPRWYYDPGTHHPADLWPVYMAETNMGRKAMLALGLPVVALGLLLAFVGWLSLHRAPLASQKPEHYIAQTIDKH